MIRKPQPWQIAPERTAPARGPWRTPVLLGLAAIAVAVGGIAAWSATAPLSSAVVASGKIAVASKRKEIQHLDGGAVKTILVRDGSVVNAGDVLFVLDDAEANVRFALARAAYYSAMTAYARLAAERDGSDAIAFPAQLLARAKQSPEIAQGIASQKRLFESRTRELGGHIDISRQKIAALKDEIRGLAAERASAVEQHGLARKEAGVIEDLFAEGFVTRQRVHAIRREIAHLAGSIGRLDASIAKARKEIDETELSIRQFALRRQTEVLTELKDTEQRLFDLNESYLAADAALARLTVTAPVGGVVVASELHTIGGVVRPGETVLEIVPADDPLIVEARVRPLDVDDVAQGQPAEVRFPAFKQRTTPTVAGTVVHVSADTAADPRTGEVYYTAVINIPYAGLGDLAARLQPGMPAELLIQTGERTVIAYLAQPLLDGMQKAFREP